MRASQTPANGDQTYAGSPIQRRGASPLRRDDISACSRETLACCGEYTIADMNLLSLGRGLEDARH